jgi:hypothetical protein
MLAAAAGGPAALLRGSLEGGWWSNGQVGVDKIGSAGGGRKRRCEVRGGLGLPSPGRIFFYFILGANSCLLPSDPNPTSQNRVGEIPNLICNEGHRFKCFSRLIVVFAL